MRHRVSDCGVAPVTHTISRWPWCGKSHHIISMYLPLHIFFNYAFMIRRLRLHIVLVRILFLFHAKKNRNQKKIQHTSTARAVGTRDEHEGRTCESSRVASYASLSLMAKCSGACVGRGKYTCEAAMRFRDAGTEGNAYSYSLVTLCVNMFRCHLTKDTDPSAVVIAVALVARLPVMRCWRGQACASSTTDAPAKLFGTVVCLSTWVATLHPALMTGFTAARRLEHVVGLAPLDLPILAAEKYNEKQTRDEQV